MKEGGGTKGDKSKGLRGEREGGGAKVDSVQYTAYKQGTTSADDADAADEFGFLLA